MTDEHLSLDELAEFDEGLLPPDRASDVQAHLDGCAECRALAASITSTRRVLANLPAEEMPAGVKDRIDRALAEDSPGAATVVPQLDAYRRRRFGRPTMAASAAAAVLVLAGGAIVIGLINNPSTSSGGAAGESASAQRAPVQPSNYVQTASGLNYTPTSLLSHVPQLVASVAATRAPSTYGTAANPAVPTPTEANETKLVPGALQPLYRSRAKLLKCAATLTGVQGSIPITVDFGRWTFESYRKSPSAIFVFRDPDPTVVDVYVIGPSCSSSSVRTYVKVPLQ